MTLLKENVRPGDDRKVPGKQNENVVSPQPSIKALEGRESYACRGKVASSKQ